MTPVLIAGIGNVFLGDDGWGVEVVRRLGERELPPGVCAVDYGIRGVHLAYDLLDQDVEVLILVDAIPGDDAPGTVALLEVDERTRVELAAGGATVDSHAMHPEAVLAALEALGGRVGRILVVGCTPQTLEPRMALSPAVAAAVEPAIELALQTAAAARPVGAG
jgi:hydrogenase maturation protease